MWHRFLAKVDQSGGPDSCWPWLGEKTDRGYGKARVRPHTTRKAHRLAWIRVHGEIETGLCVCHHCDNRLCCNPAHLFLGTGAENTADMISKGRAAFQQPGYVPPRPPTDRTRRFTEAQILEIRKLHAVRGLGYGRIARRFGCHAATIACIVKRRTWAHLPAADYGGALCSPSPVGACSWDPIRADSF